MTTTTPTSGAAELPDAMHMAELLENPITIVCQKTAAAVLRHQHSEFERLHALAAGQATAAQHRHQAALSESFLEIPDVQDESGINAYYSREVVLECIDAALASHGQAPAAPKGGIDE